MNPKLHLKIKIVDNVTGEVLCGCGCGLVIIEKTSENKTPGFDTEAKSIHYKTENNFEHDKGLGSTISHVYFEKSKPSKKQNEIDHRLRKWNEYSRINNSSNRRLLEYFQKLNSLENELGLSPVLKNDIISFIRKLEKIRLLEGKKSEAVILVLTYFAKRLHGISFNLKDYDFRTSTYLRYIEEFKTGLVLDVNQLQTPRMSVMVSICSKLNISQKTMNSAISIIDYCVDKGMFVSKQPSILAATCLYVVSMNNDKKILLTDFAEAASCTTTSISSLKKEMKDVFEIFNLSVHLTQAITGLKHQERFI